ncbi:hypothetical protein MIND_01252700 [Mycena indigotica]|uniref:F-box domain-containing protein n=1 Tax=Mycena indigotica TaxID=2126181 RepID=A0A8H6S4M5_9AGAR|nr:uncharacterized protein MIND_01252700 [Mycena indigotica]KAF7292253.1 hypothetical protein MIND_01252700 [Mycena indigotica]
MTTSHATAQAPTSRNVDIRRRLEHLYQAAATLQTEISLLETQLVYPVLTLAPEVTGEIFHWAAKSTGDSKLVSFLLAIGSVCRAWRRIAHGQAALWSRIALDCVRLRWPEELLAALWLPKSRALPLDISILFRPDVDNTSNEAVMDAIAHHASRWRRVSLGISPSVGSDYRAYRRPANGNLFFLIPPPDSRVFDQPLILERLSLSNVCIYQPPASARADTATGNGESESIFKRCPRLTHLSITPAATLWMSFPILSVIKVSALRAVTVLCISQCSLDDTLQALTATPCLVSLTLLNPNANIFEDSEQFSAPEEPLELAHLQNLTCDGPSTDPLSILNYLCLPLLHSLTIAQELDDDDVTIFRHLIERSQCRIGNVTLLDVEFGGWRESSMADFLLLFPFARCVTIEYADTELRPRSTKPDFERCEDIEAKRPGMLLPALKQLCVHGMSRDAMAPIHRWIAERINRQPEGQGSNRAPEIKIAVSWSAEEKVTTSLRGLRRLVGGVEVVGNPQQLAKLRVHHQWE